MRVGLALLMMVFAALPAWAQKAGVPGQYEYYVLSLSWSPTWCATRGGANDQEQCGTAQPRGFVVHGLWPQYAKGGYPAECAVPGQVAEDITQGMLSIMPSRKLVQHQWRRHGTCSGASPEGYFAQTRRAYDKVAIPPALQQPKARQTLTVREVENLFSTANPGLGPDSLAVVCRGRFIAEVRVCMDKDLKFRTCGRDVGDRCKGDAIFPLPR